MDIQGIDVSSLLRDLESQNLSQRLWNKDPSLWKSDPAAQASIRNRLGWLDLHKSMAGSAASLKAFADEVKKERFTNAVVLGMGGSSLCPEVFRLTFGRRKGYPGLHVLDTTDPRAILDVEKKISLPKTLFIVSSKSGSTIEVNSLYRYFFAKMQKARNNKAGRNFVAVTDPGTPLEKMAAADGFRKVFLSPPDVGGRYSALTYFGLAPAALLGMEVRELLARAARMAGKCAPGVPLNDNPALKLGAALGLLGKAGRDKLTFFLSPEISSFGLWLEQLIAESTGKEGKGLVPVEGEPPQKAEVYGTDRVFIHMKLKGAKDKRLDALLEDLVKAGHPVITLTLEDALDLGAEFLRWEMAVAGAAVVLGINPFDEPNVSESKANTNRILAQWEAVQKPAEEPPLFARGKTALWADKATADAITGADAAGSLPQALAAPLSAVKAGQYVALMAYLTPSPANHKALQNLRAQILVKTRASTTLGYGPRFLHSTGQLHKGGDNNGFFIQVTAEDRKDLRIPGARYGFSTLKKAQAQGDFEALKSHERRAVRLQFSASPAPDIEKLAASLKKFKIPA